MNPTKLPKRRFRSQLQRRIRAEAPKIGFAVRFLPPDQRESVLAITAFLTVLNGIISPTQSQPTDEGETANPFPTPDTSSSNPLADSATATPTNNHTAADHVTTTTTASDSCCSSSSNAGNLEFERTIAGNIVDFVYSPEAIPGAIGAAEIEMFLPAKDSFNLADSPFRDFIRAMADLYSRKRIATIRTLRDDCDRIAESIVKIFSPIFSLHLLDDPDRSSDELHWNFHSLVRAILITRLLADLGRSWKDQQQFPMPLDILAHHGLRDSDFTRFLEDDCQQPSPESSPSNWCVLEDLANDAAESFAETPAILSHFNPPTSRTILLYALQWKTVHQRFERIIISRHGSALRQLWNKQSARVLDLNYIERLRALRQALTLNTSALQLKKECAAP